MADITITITGPRGAGKTTFAKHLFNHLANGTYYVTDVEDSDSLATQYVKEPKQLPRPIVRAPRSVEIIIRETTFDSDTDILDDDEDD
jgi:deoxyadenosine/deoxycytidine kinase